MKAVRAWWRRVAGVFAGRRAEQRAGGGAREPPAAPHRRQPARRHDAGRGAAPGARRPRRPGVDQGGLSRSARPAGDRIAAARPALRPAHAAQEPGVRRRRHRHPRPRHRRQLGDLHRGQRRGAATAALCRRRPAWCGCGTRRRSPPSRACGPSRCRRPTSSTGRRRARRLRDGDLPRRPADADRTRRTDGGAEPAGVGELSADLRAAAGDRPWLHRRRRPRRRHADGAAERGLLAHPLWQRPDDSRPADPAQPHRLHGDRRGAGPVVPRQRRRSGRRSSGAPPTSPSATITTIGPLPS